MADSTTMANGHASTTSGAPSIPPEIEATLSRLSAYRNVRGVMIISRSTSSGMPAGVVQSTGSVFQGEGGKKYARVVESLAGSVASAVGEVDEGDELKFMRIRTKRHELIVTPDEKYLLVVLQDPGQ